MQRHHRQRHRFMWLILTPIILGALYIAITNRPAPAVNDTLPTPAASAQP